MAELLGLKWQQSRSILNPDAALSAPSVDNAERTKGARPGCSHRLRGRTPDPETEAPVTSLAAVRALCCC
ncbi:hypothetical protein [Actinopolymorpha pittospori]|uniref:Uncharacterized protein n=1 Tax=Actinopolymorpha pittospori TaxID=648752 RepID=A0A927MV37_9ACTN|nr:hypothetical protein [Actinopolymorpha pittospori]MBE1606941.1 hypothetical protein [Actinopolymorpha pittospori]